MVKKESKPVYSMLKDFKGLGKMDFEEKYN
jgi:hypothetical protein